MSRDNPSHIFCLFVFPLFKTNKKNVSKSFLFCRQKKQKEKIDFFTATQTNASLHKKEKSARFVFFYYHTTFANSTGERASHRRRERGLNRAKTRSTHAVWRRRERFRGRKIINHIRLLGIRRDDDDIISVQSKALIITEIENDS
tara:strand:- start:2176 stop:2610 length:435 start_codon:yes stop_codon:yes gene_type:complete